MNIFPKLSIQTVEHEISEYCPCYGMYNIPDGIIGMYLPADSEDAFPIECGQGFLCEKGRQIKCRRRPARGRVDACTATACSGRTA
jgi:hypothetical protein